VRDRLTKAGTAMSKKIEAMSNISNLDFLRASAVLLVFTNHLVETLAYRFFGDLGKLGVLLFFVHTSFVLMASMDRLELSGFNLVKSFFIRRAFRIYPLSFLTVTAFLVLRIPTVSWADSYSWPGWSCVLSNILLIQNIAHSMSINCVLWSLPYEVQMYAALPLLYILLKKYRSIWASLSIILVGVSVALMEYAMFYKDSSMDWMILRYIPCFVAGVIAWRYFKEQGRRYPSAYWILAILSLAIIYRVLGIVRVYGVSFFATKHLELRSDHLIWWPNYCDMFRDWFFCGVAGLLLLYFKDIQNKWIKFASAWIAKYSYGIYLCHIAVMWFSFHVIHKCPTIFRVLLSIGMTAVVSYLLFHLIESPAIKLGKRLAMKLEKNDVGK